MTDRTENRRDAGVDTQHEGLPCWVVLVTEGLSVAFPPEVYVDEPTAEREAERWAWALSCGGRCPVEKPFPGRWQVGGMWIRLVPTRRPPEARELWVGTHWTMDGYPEPEALLLPSSSEARRWATTPPAGAAPLRVRETPWAVVATFGVRGGEADSEAHLAKVVT